MRLPRLDTLARAMLGVSLATTLVVTTVAAQGPTTVRMNPQNSSGQSGTATLTDMGGGKTKVVLDLASSPAGPQPAHIHEGTCASLNPAPKYPLTNVMAGKSETTVDVSLADLMKGKFAINVHKSPQDIPTYVSCGDITASANAAAPGGTMPRSGGLALPLGGLLLAGLATIAVGLLFRRRSA